MQCGFKCGDYCQPVNGLGGTYTFSTDLPILGDVRTTVPMDAMVEEAYGSVRNQIVGDLPLIALSAFGIVVAGVIVGNLLVRPRSG